MNDDESDTENRSTCSPGLEDEADEITDTEVSPEMQEISNTENSQKVDFLFTPSDSVSAADLKLIDKAMVDCILRDTIRGVKSHYPEFNSKIEVYHRLEKVWEVYKNTRMYKGDFMGLKMSFNMAMGVDSHQGGCKGASKSSKMLSDFYKDYKKQQGQISLNGYHAKHQKEIKLKRASFIAKFKLYERNPKQFSELQLRQKGSVPLLSRDMEMELVTWIYRCNHRGSAPSGTDIREKGLFLCRSDVSHWNAVKKEHSHITDSSTALSQNWWKSFLDRSRKMSPPLHIL